MGSTLPPRVRGTDHLDATEVKNLEQFGAEGCLKRRALGSATGIRRRNRVPQQTEFREFVRNWSGREDLNLRPLGPEPRKNLLSHRIKCSAATTSMPTACL